MKRKTVGLGRRSQNSNIFLSILSLGVILLGLVAALGLVKGGVRIWPKAYSPQTIDCQHQATWNLSSAIANLPQGMVYIRYQGNDYLIIAAGNGGSVGQIIGYNVNDFNNPVFNHNGTYTDPQSQVRKLKWFHDVTTDGTYFYVHHHDELDDPDSYVISKFLPSGTCVETRELVSTFGVSEGMAIDSGGDVFLSRYNDVYIGGVGVGQTGIGFTFGNGQLADPRGLFADDSGAEDYVYVPDRVGNKLVRFYEQSFRSWAFKDQLTSLFLPRDVAISPGRYLYIVEQPESGGDPHHHVQRYPSMAGGTPETCGTDGQGQFFKPMAIAFNPAGQNEEFYVVDRIDSYEGVRVQKFVWLLPTPTPLPGECGARCEMNDDCNTQYICYSDGYCRNPSCPSDPDCVCFGPSPTPTRAICPTENCMNMQTCLDQGGVCDGRICRVIVPNGCCCNLSPNMD